MKDSLWSVHETDIFNVFNVLNKSRCSDIYPLLLDLLPARDLE